MTSFQKVIFPFASFKDCLVPNTVGAYIVKSALKIYEKYIFRPYEK